MSLEDYINICFDKLDDKHFTLPNCIITTNIRLLVASILKWECFKISNSPTVRNFYIHCVILLSQQTDKNTFISILQKIINVAYSKFPNSFCKTSFNELKTELESKKIRQNFSNEILDRMYLEYSIISNKDLCFLDIKKCTTIVNYIENIFSNAQINLDNSDSTDSRESAFHNNEFCINLKSLAYHFLIWTNIMISRELSLDVFDQLKNNLKEDPLLNVDQFLVKSIDYSSRTIFDSSLWLNRKKNETKSKRKNIDQSFMKFEENWKNKNPQANEDSNNEDEDDIASESSSDRDSTLKSSSSSDSELDIDICDIISEELEESSKLKTLNNVDLAEPMEFGGVKEEEIIENTNDKKLPLKNLSIQERGQYLRPCPSIDIIRQTPKNKRTTKRKVLENCNLFTVVKGLKEKISISTSSNFDSIFEIILTIYYEFSKFNVFINNCLLENMGPEALFLKCLQNYVKDMNLNKLYKARTEMIKNCYSTHEEGLLQTKDVFRIICNKTVGEMYRKLMIPSIFQEWMCNICSQPKYSNHSTIQMSLKEASDGDILKNIVKSLNTPLMCNTCNRQMIVNKMIFQCILCFDVEHNERGTKECLFNLNELKTSIKVNDKEFVLIGVVGFEEPICNRTERHYIAWTKHLLEKWWYQFNDTEITKKFLITRKKIIMVNIALIVYAEMETPLKASATLAIDH